MIKMNYQMKFQDWKLIKKLFSIVLLLTFISSNVNAQFDIPTKPSNGTSLYDYAGLLSADQSKYLEQKLINYFDTTGNQIVVAIVQTIDGADIGILTPEWGHKWGIGGKKNDNGVFILLAVEEREIYIAPGYGLEHLLTAGINGEIIRNDIIPHFKQGDYFAGLDEGTNQLMNLFSGVYKHADEDSSVSWLFLFLFIAGPIILFIILAYIAGNSGGGSNGGSSYTSGGYTSRSSGGFFSGSSGGGRSSGSSGGFGGGFGGGGFSGGGAGGKW